MTYVEDERRRHSTKPWGPIRDYVEYSIFKADNSDVPPILNAFELYMAKFFSEPETSQDDIEAITMVKSAYKIKKNSWQGDPCSPQNLMWEGLKCSHHETDSMRIISLDLSSSGLTGEIAASISDLLMIQTLDLSNNSLTGPIPQFLSQLPNLKILNLGKNKLTGSVPLGLMERNSEGLTLSLCENPNLSGIVSCKKKKHNSLIPILVSILLIIILLLTVATIWLAFKMRRQLGDTKGASTIQFGSSLESTKRKFTFSEILQITNNFERILGKGGFGSVYYGNIDKMQVAVKILAQASLQGLQQFQSEVDLLMRVHHKNLTSLVGYMNDETNVGLVYEYMANGNLQELLSDTSSYVLTWESRLQIAIDSAKGLEYLHYDCKPPMIHRDVKSANILLNENFDAKLSDFGLSKKFPTNDGTNTSSLIAGTPGYLDPEVYISNRINEKIDVYSFGVVLLEIITSRPVISRTPERVHISQWVGLMLAQGDISTIVDPRLEGNFSVNSVWKAVEIAMACVSTNVAKRPSMSQVVTELQECMELARPKQSDTINASQNSLQMFSVGSIAKLAPSVR